MEKRIHEDLIDCLEANPVIAAICDDSVTRSYVKSMGI